MDALYTDWAILVKQPPARLPLIVSKPPRKNGAAPLRLRPLLILHIARPLLIGSVAAIYADALREFYLRNHQYRMLSLQVSFQ